MIATFIIIIINNWIVTPFLFLYIVLIIYFFKIFIKTSMELRRLEQLAYSPLLSNINELYNGIIVLRGFN